MIWLVQLCESSVQQVLFLLRTVIWRWRGFSALLHPGGDVLQHTLIMAEGAMGWLLHGREIEREELLEIGGAI